MPRNKKLPLFQPHIKFFSCELESEKVPPIDAQADEWFHQARTLQSPEIYYKNRDYRKIVLLTRMAAERHHWKAMLNLASLYIEGLDPPHGVQDAIEIVEKAILLEIPAAYDRMGTYYMNGTGVTANATKAYAFWQRAAEMGNPQAMTFLAGRLYADRNDGDHWDNIPVATKMLECALGQGFGQAAYNLYYLYASPRSLDGTIIGPRTIETKDRALRVLHQGVKLGCAECARDLAGEFARPFGLSDTFVPYLDKARGARYAVINEALDFDPSDRFPNLDKVLPLPPAALPRWNGDRDTLLNAARGISPLSPYAKPTAASVAVGRHFLEAAYLLRKSDHMSKEKYAPIAGYWQPTMDDQPKFSQGLLACVSPVLYQRGEAFERFSLPPEQGWGYVAGAVWQHFLTIHHNLGDIQPRTAGPMQVLARPKPHVSCNADVVCTVTGIWQPWIHHDHPLAAVVNQHWRQAWVLIGQPFPEPQREWFLDLPLPLVSWNLMDAAAVEVNK